MRLLWCVPIKPAMLYAFIARTITANKILRANYTGDALTGGFAVPQAILNKQSERVLTLALSDGTTRYAALLKNSDAGLTTKSIRLRFGNLDKSRRNCTATAKLGKCLTVSNGDLSGITTPCSVLEKVTGATGAMRGVFKIGSRDYWRSGGTYWQRLNYIWTICWSLWSDSCWLTPNQPPVSQNDRIGLIDFDDCGMGTGLDARLELRLDFNEHHAAAPEWVGTTGLKLWAWSPYQQWRNRHWFQHLLCNVVFRWWRGLVHMHKPGNGTQFRYRLGRSHGSPVQIWTINNCLLVLHKSCWMKLLPSSQALFFLVGEM